MERGEETDRRDDHASRRRLLGVLAGGAGTALAGCVDTLTPDDGDGGDGGDDGMQTQGPGSGGSLDRTVRLGILMAQSGDLGSIVRPVVNAAALPVSQVNEADVPLTVDRRIEDTGSEAGTGVEVANQMVSDGIPMICGPAGSGVNIQVAKQVLIPNGVVGCSPASTSPTVTALNDDDLVYRTALSDAFQGRVLARVAAERIEASSAVTMHIDNNYGLELSTSFTETFEQEYDGTVATQVPFPSGADAYTSELEQAVGSNDPDVTVIIGYPDSGEVLLQNYYDNYSGDLPLLLTDGLQDPELAQSVDATLDNVSGTAPSTSGPGRDAFRSLYQSRYGIEPGVFTPNGYDAAAVLLLANVAAGSNDGTEIATSMNEVANPDGMTVTPDNLVEGVEAVADGDSVQYEGASSPVDFDSNGDLSAATFEYWQFQGESIETVDTVTLS